MAANIAAAESPVYEEDDFVSVAGDGDLAGADGSRLALEQGAGEDVYSVSSAGGPADGVLEAAPGASVGGGGLGDGIGEQEGGADGFG
jgi:hypothetical protein